MDQFKLINQQEQPYIQSGYGALGRLNTLLGLSPNPNQTPVRPPQGITAPIQGTPYSGLVGHSASGPGMRIPYPVQGPPMGQPMGMQGNPQQLQLRQILQLRAMHGDTQAGQILQRLP